MSAKLLSSSLAAGCVFSLIVSAQAPAQQSSPPPTAEPTETSDQQNDAGSPVTLSGCVLKESSVLKPGAIATATMGAGMGDEFVLTQATIGDASAPIEKPEADAAAPPNEPVGTSGTETGFGKVYRLTGEQESELKDYIGQRVVLVGVFKHDEDAKTEAGAVGTSGRSGELTAANTPEFTITSITPSTGSCSVPAIK
jgi:hypothetical protein